MESHLLGFFVCESIHTQKARPPATTWELQLVQLTKHASSCSHRHDDFHVPDVVIFYHELMPKVTPLFGDSPCYG